MSGAGIARIAIIGGGISGLAAAYLLSRRFRVTVLEREPRLGGHTLSVPVDAPEGPRNVDMGFSLHNRATYPNLCRLLAELKVDSVESELSFAVHGGRQGVTWCFRGLNSLFAQRTHALSLRFHSLLREVRRFHKLGHQLMEDGANQDVPLEGFLEEHGFGAPFREHYLYPLGGALWSEPPAAMVEFPAFPLLAFLRNNQLLGMRFPPLWRAIPGGASRYLEPLTRPFADGIRLGVEIAEVRRGLDGVAIRTKEGEDLRFDQVVFACHGDQALPLLGDPTKAEREVLAPFRTSRNPAVLHTDAGLLPKARRAWAARNVQTTPDPERLLANHHLNRVQALETRQEYFLGLGMDSLVEPKAVLRRAVFHHPRFDLATLHAQSRWEEISGRYSAFGRTHYCGAHWGLGMHEDGLNSAIRVAQSLGIQW